LAEIGEDTSFGRRHPLPDVEKFAGTLSSLGISTDSNMLFMMIRTEPMPQRELGGCSKPLD